MAKWLWLPIVVLIPLAAVADTLPLTLKLWTIKGAPTITCTGKSWVDVEPGLLNREAVIALLSTANPSAQDERLLACDDGSGRDAPITGAMSQVQVARAGQTVLRGPVRIIMLKPHAKHAKNAGVVLAVSKLAGDVALTGKNGQGTLRLDHKVGIDIYPASYTIVKVIETSDYQIDNGPAPLLQPCSVFYYHDDPMLRPKVIKSKFDCVTLIENSTSAELFSGKLPGKI